MIVDHKLINKIRLIIIIDNSDFISILSHELCNSDICYYCYYFFLDIFYFDWKDEDDQDDQDDQDYHDDDIKG